MKKRLIMLVALIYILCLIFGGKSDKELLSGGQDHIHWSRRIV